MVRKITPTSGGWRKYSGTTDNQHALEEAATRAITSLPSSTTTWRTATVEQLTAPLMQRRFAPAIVTAFHTAATALVELETAALSNPTNDTNSLIGAFTYRKRLRSLLTFKDHADARLRKWVHTTARSLQLIADVAPEMSTDALSLNATVPLIEMVPQPANLVAQLVSQILEFAQDDADAISSGAVLACQVKELILCVSKLSADAAAKNPYRLTSPEQSGLAGKELVAAYLGRDNPYYALLTTPVPFSIPRATYAEHGAVFAPAGHGKTQTLQGIVLSFLNEQDPPPMFIIDSMGAMLDRIARLDVFNTTLKDRILILDPKDGPALNFFKLKGGSDAQQTELFFYLFKAIEQALTPRQATMVSYLVELMQVIDGANLHTLREVCETKQLQYTHALARLPQISQDFFRHQFMGQDALIKATKAQIAARLYTVGRNAVFNAMFSANENNFDAYDCIAKKKIVLISTDRVALGDAGSAIFGRFILAQCLAAALSRVSIPERERHLALIVVDEAKSYLDDQAEKILSDARQFGLGMLLATQAPHQLPESVQREVANNTSIKLLGPVPYATASQFARDMHTTPEFIQSMKSRTHAEFACYVRNLTPRAVKLSIPIGALEAAPKMDDEAYRRMRERNRQAVTQTPANTAPMRKAATNISAAPAAPQPLSPKPSQWDSDHGEVGG